MEHNNRNLPSREEVARQAALQEAARALASRPSPQHGSTEFQSSVEEQCILDALAMTSPARRRQAPSLATTKVSIPPAVTTELPLMKSVQLRNIDKPHANDVLVGNAMGSGDIHVGNVKYYKLIDSQKIRYLQQMDAEGREMVAQDIVTAIRAQNPAGRFLKRKRRKYHDVGALDAIEYTLYSLRQGTHELAKMIAASSSTPFFAALAAEQRMATAAAPLPPPAVDSWLTSIPANPPLSGEAAIRNAMFPQAQDDAAFDAIAKAMNRGNLGNGASNDAFEKLAAEFLTDRARNQADAARLMEASVASLPANSSKPQLVAPSTRKSNIGRGIPNLPLHSHAGGLGNLLPPPPLDHGPSPSVASQLGNIPHQQTLNSLPTARQSLVSNQSEERQRLNSNDRNQASCSKDVVERLVFAETMAQRTLQGTATNALKAEEKRMGLYLDAGLLGIDFGEMVEQRKQKQSEESIVEESYAKLRRKRNHDDDGDEKRRAAKEPPTKKQRAVTANGSVQDSDALNAVGAMIQMQRQTSDCETETESESD